MWIRDVHGSKFLDPTQSDPYPMFKNPGPNPTQAMNGLDPCTSLMWIITNQLSACQVQFCVYLSLNFDNPGSKTDLRFVNI